MASVCILVVLTVLGVPSTALKSTSPDVAHKPSCAFDTTEYDEWHNNAYTHLKQIASGKSNATWPEDPTFGPVFYKEQLEPLDKLTMQKVSEECEGFSQATDEECNTPLSQLVTKKRGFPPYVYFDAYCYFNYFAAVSLSFQDAKWLANIHSAKLPAVVAARDAIPSEWKNPSAKNAGRVSFAAGADAGAGLICYDNDYLDLPEAVISSLAAAKSEAKTHCENLKTEFPEYEKLALQDAKGLLLDIGMGVDAMNPDRKDTRKMELFKCLLGEDGVASMLSSCKYNYCKLENVNKQVIIGMGRQCRKDWMNSDDIDILTTWHKQ